MFEISICNVIYVSVTIKFFFCWQFCFIKSFSTINVFVRINYFLSIKQNLSMSPSQSLYMFPNLFTKSSLKYFLWFLLHFKHLIMNDLSIIFIYSRQDLQHLHVLLLRSSAILSARLDSEPEINLKLSINFISYVANLLFFNSFCISTEKFMYFFLFCFRDLNYPITSFINSFMIK